MRINFLDTTSANNLAVIVIIYLAILLSGCTEMGNREYKYIVTSMQTNLQNIEPKEQKPLLIEAKSDSVAYIKAYINFCLAKKGYNEEFKKSGTMAGKPLSFRLLNEHLVDITGSVIFINKAQTEKNLEERVASFELKKNN